MSERQGLLNYDAIEGSGIINTINKGNAVENPFENPEIAEYYSRLYEKSRYEGRCHYDPKFKWTQQEEKTVIRLLDKNITLWACIMFVGLQIDRGNLTQAVSDNMLSDLHLTTNDYNLGNTIFLVCFLLAEIPSQLISKRLGPDRWIPIQITLWSIVAAYQVALDGKTCFLITRGLLGTLEGGFIPDMILWLSYFFTNKELPIRLSIFWTVQSVTQIVSALMAFVILRLRGCLGLQGWRWLFFIEGLMTFSLGIISFFIMPASSVQTSTRYQPKGWLTKHQEKLAINRILRDDPSKGDMNNRRPLSLKNIYYAFQDYHLWPIYLLGMVVFIPTRPMSFYFTLVLRNLGFDPFTTNLLTIPSTVLHIFLFIGITKLSQRLNERAIVCLIQPIWIAVFLGIIRFWYGSQVETWPSYFLLTILLGHPYIHAILAGWCSANANSVASRTVSVSLYTISVHIGTIISANVYRHDDAPLYLHGNKLLFLIDLAMPLLLLASKFYYITINQKRDKLWNKMSVSDRKQYLEYSSAVGNKRLDFRFAH